MVSRPTRTTTPPRSDLTAANVAQVTQRWQATLPHFADGTPAVAFGVSTPSGAHDLVFVTTKAGDLVALDLHTGAQLWSITFGPGTCKINNGSSTCYTTSSPAVDQTGGFVYTYGLDGKVHKVAIGTGVENTTAPWPVVATLKPFDEKGSSALSTATPTATPTSTLTTAGYPGDGGDYQGHLTAIDLATGASKVFNTAVQQPDRPLRRAAGHARTAARSRAGCGPAPAPPTRRPPTSSTSPPATPPTSPAGHDWGDSVLALHPDGTGVAGDPVDCYTPDQLPATLNSTDQDLGSTLPALVTLPAGALAPDGSALARSASRAARTACSV